MGKGEGGGDAYLWMTLPQRMPSDAPGYQFQRGRCTDACSIPFPHVVSSHEALVGDLT